MKSDEGIFKMLSKSIIIRNQYENVIISTQTKIQKGQFLLPFFLSELKICSELCSELLEFLLKI